MLLNFELVFKRLVELVNHSDVCMLSEQEPLKEMLNKIIRI